MNWKNFWTWTVLVLITVIVHILLVFFIYPDLTKKALILEKKDVQTDIEDLEAYSHPKYGHLEKHGLPTNINILERKNYLVSYDTKNKIPFWVMEHLTSDMITAEKLGKRKNQYYEDISIHEYFRSTNRDYMYSGYDKGHFAPAENYHYCQDATDETFYLSGMAPQLRNINSGVWKTLEEHARAMAVKYGSIYICCGPLFLPRKRKRLGGKIEKYMKYGVIGDDNVSVPTHFFKVILCEVEENVHDMECYIIQNEYVGLKRKPDEFKVSKEKIERHAGFLIFDEVLPNTFRYINGSLKNEELLSSTIIPMANVQLDS